MWQIFNTLGQNIFTDADFLSNSVADSELTFAVCEQPGRSEEIRSHASITESKAVPSDCSDISLC